MPDQTQAQPQFTPQEFAAKIKTKYPAYASMADDQLISKITAKYPQYKSSIKFDTSAERGAAQATGLSPVVQKTGKEGMQAALASPQIQDLERGNVEGAKLLTDVYGGKAILGLIGKALAPTSKMVPVAGKILDAQGNPVIQNVEEIGESAAKRTLGMTKDAVKNVLKWANANPLPSYAIYKTLEELGIAPHKVMKILHVASKD